MNTAIVLMGVSGSGKTTIGSRLSQQTGLPFFEGDEYHPQANIDKMSRGQPLNDQDRRSWLQSLHELIRSNLEDDQSLILACSALKEKYRETLRGDLGDRLVFVHLKGRPGLIHQRMQNRQDHYMKAEMLHSQFAALEEPEDVLTVEVSQPIPSIVDEIIDQLDL